MAIDKYKPVHTPRDLPLGKCVAYLVKIGVHWMTANELVGKYSLDEIRQACLTMQRNSVNVRHREKYLRTTLEGKDYPC